MPEPPPPSRAPCAERRTGLEVSGGAAWTLLDGDERRAEGAYDPT